MRRLVPLWVWRVLPYRLTRWAFRRELERGREYVERIGWTD